jgi:hypothetical protein
VFGRLLDTASKGGKKIVFVCGCAKASLNKASGKSEVGKAMVSGDNIVLPCSEYDEPL